MNIKDFLLPLLFAFLTVFALQYFFSPQRTVDQKQDMKSGQRFKAPKSTELEVLKPLNIEVDFIDDEPVKKSVTTIITTEQARYEFSTDGASLTHLSFNPYWSDQKEYLTTIQQSDVSDKESCCFLLALQEKTPFYYDLVSEREEEDRHLIKYKASFDEGTITKEFAIFKHEYKVDLTIAIEPKIGFVGTMQPRMFFNSPVLSELPQDVVSGLVNEGSGKVKTFAKNEETLSTYWSKPSIFGMQDRYFVHTLFNDRNNFVQRGYYTVSHEDNLRSILEGPAVNEKSSWTISFYMGPKIADAMIMVDPRLEQTINYGFISFISRPLSKVILVILNFLYRLFNNYGMAIVILTVLMRLLLVPFTFKTQKTMKQAQQMQKKLKHLEQMYKDDKEGLARARAEFMKKHGMPGLTGCLPLLMQLPLFITLAWVLNNSILLYKASFLWINDLSSPDPYYILPILAGVSMIFHNPTGDPKQQVSSMMMGLVMMALFINFPAGLALYISMSTALGVLQTVVIRRMK